MLQHDRLRRIFENATGEPDVVAIVNGNHPDPNFFYISGYRNGLFERSMLFLFSDGHIEVLTNPLEEEAARQREDYTVHIEGRKTKKRRTGNDPSERRGLVTRILKGCRRIGVNYQGLSHGDYEELSAMLGKGAKKELLDVSDALSRSRMVKDTDELESIYRAAEIVSRTVEEVPGLVEERMTERTLKAKIDYLMIENGADSTSFESIVAFGENSALPHYSAGERRLRRGDNILVDIGARYKLYCSDLTRTFFFGRAPDTQRQAYATVLEAQTKAIAGIRAGVTGAAVHEIAARVVEQSKFRGRFTHSLGHSIGLEVHDGPGLAVTNSQNLRENMVMTIEPGVYLPGEGGVRIEDDAVITKVGCREITCVPKALLEI